jgi:hypothetical protein
MHPTRRSAAVLLSAGALAGTPADAAAQERPGDGVRELWRDYPLDDRRTTETPPAGSADSSSAPVDPAGAPTAAEGGGESVPAALPLVVVAVAIAVVLVLRAVRRRPSGRRMDRRAGRAL